MEEANTVDFPSSIRLATDVVSAYVVNNHIAASDLPSLIGLVHAALLSLSTGATPTPTEEVEKLTSAQIRKSVTPAALISFIDGKPYKTLKRHLTKHGLDPASYRARYGLPSDYPMVAQDYSATRSSLATSLGLGRKGASEAEAAPEAPRRTSRRASSRTAH